jgi:hypothetical protein
LPPAYPPGSVVGEPGDCAFLGFKSDAPDDFAILLLNYLPAGATLFVTDMGWYNGDWIPDLTQTPHDETVLSYTPTVDRLAGVVLRYSDFSHYSGATFDLGTSGDNLHVFVGSVASPSFLCSISFDSTEYSGGTSAERAAGRTTELPPGLTEGVDAITGYEADNGMYMHWTGITHASKKQLLAAINDVSNWHFDNGWPLPCAPDPPCDDV